MNIVPEKTNKELEIIPSNESCNIFENEYKKTLNNKSYVPKYPKIINRYIEGLKEKYGYNDRIAEEHLYDLLMSRDSYLKLYKENETHKKIATVDILTGLENRGSFDKYLNETIGNANRHGNNVSLLFLDMDHFKYINDTHGHDNGDKALKILSNIFKSNVRGSDKVFRYGGEEFCIVLNKVNEKDAKTIGEDIRKKVELSFKKELGIEDEGISGTISVGLSTNKYKKNSLALDEKYLDGKSKQITKKADLAMYYSKENGRNKLTTYTDEIGIEMKDKKQKELNEIKNYLNENNINPEAQELILKLNISLKEIKKVKNGIDIVNKINPFKNKKQETEAFIKLLETA